MVQIPKVNSSIFYFPQGHAEHACEPVNFSANSKIPSQISCRVAAIHYRADPHTDELYAKLRLVPLSNTGVSFDDDAVGGINDMPVTRNKYKSYTKTLTRTDASSGLFCPKICVETIFPPLDYLGNHTSQDIYVTDVHGETWEFKHVCRGTPKVHMLTTGWSDFLKDKQLVSGDSLVFLRAENGDIHVGIRRSKRQNDIGVNPSSKRKLGSENGIRIGSSYFGLTSSSEEIDNKLQQNDQENGWRISDKIMGRGKVKAEDVLEAVRLAVNMQPFDVVYYPRVGTPEFFVKPSLIRKALQIRRCCGMRFKMAIEMEDSSRTHCFIGTIASVQAADPAWPDSLWRLLQVTWDVSYLLKNTKRVNPWQVEIVSNMPPSRKKPRLLEYQAFPIDGQFSMPVFHLPETSPAGMQGARHDPFGLSLSDLHINESPLGLLNPNFQQPFDHNATPSMTVPSNAVLQKANDSENVSCSASEKQDHAKPTQIVLLGQTIRIDPGHENAVKKKLNKCEWIL
ncbi:auxin response factor 8 [Lathyrus oleraceus]|uniref:Auxin response factor n=1 Tax=Pisum sativum TaxID=3888 RepID=A0A9D4XWC4_PEA|nr:auxin response factor 8-like [Pisum sativum]XP_050910597.1 auxin response factor 8-like [Pisum sativum]KAI5425896.1 hypothetical protein KIW84_031646 [Pisum sativum]